MIMNKKISINNQYDSSNLSARIEIYVNQLKASQKINPDSAAKEARTALRRTGVMSKTSTTTKKRIVTWE